jgi:hypothetical protein
MMEFIEYCGVMRYNMAFIRPRCEPSKPNLGTSIVLILPFEYYIPIYAYVYEVVSPFTFFEPVLI